MDASDAIKEISPKRREILVAAWQNIKPETSMKTLFSKCNIASAMAAVNFRKPKSKFERSLKGIRKQTSPGKKDERERRVPAFLVFLSPQTGLDDFLKVVDFPAATRALGKTYSEKWFKEYTRIIVRSVLEKSRPIDHIENDDDDQEGSDDQEENDDDGHDRSIVAASLSSSNNVVDLTDGDEKIMIDLTNEDDDGDNIATSSTSHPLKTGKKRKLPGGDDEVKTGTNGTNHKRPRLADHQDTQHGTHTSSNGNETEAEVVMHQSLDHVAEDGQVSVNDSDKSKKRATSPSTTTTDANKDTEQAPDQLAPQALACSIPCSTEGVPRSSVLSNDEGAATIPALLDFHTPAEDDGESLFLPEFVKPVPKQSQTRKEKTVTFAATDRIYRIPNDNVGRKFKQSASKTSASDIKGPGKAGSAPSKLTSAQLSRRIQWFDVRKQELSQISEKKHKRA